MKARLKISDIRNFLKNNKIFFETIVAVLLSVMAITVSVGANKIASYQVSLMKMQHFPVLHFDIALEYDYNKKFFVCDQLTISNIGSPLSEFQCEVAVFFEVEYGQVNKESKIVRIPLIAYYPLIFPTGSATGEAVRFVNPDENHEKAISVSQDFHELAKNQGAFGLAGIVRYVQVRYKDIFGTKHREVYFVSQMETRKLLEKEGVEIFEEYHNKIEKNQYVEFLNISASELYKKWSVAVNEQKK